MPFPVFSSAIFLTPANPLRQYIARRCPASVLFPAGDFPDYNGAVNVFPRVSALSGTPLPRLSGSSALLPPARYGCSFFRLIHTAGRSRTVLSAMDTSRRFPSIWMQEAFISFSPFDRSHHMPSPSFPVTAPLHLA